MSLIIHRCTECGHADHEHNESRHQGRSCSFGFCPCSKVLDQVRAEPSVLIPGWTEGGESVTKVAIPGSRLVENPQAGVVFACGCDSCKSAYADIAGGAA